MSKGKLHEIYIQLITGRRWWWIALASVITSTLLFVFAAHMTRNMPAQTKMTNRPVDLPPYNNLRFEPPIIGTTQLDILIDQVANRVATIARNHTGFRLSDMQIEALSHFAQERVRLTLSPDREKWLDAATRYVPNELLRDITNQAYDADWSMIVRVWKYAPISIKDIALRRLRVENRNNLIAQFGPSMSRSQLRPPYPSSPPNTSILEVVVPMMIQESRSDTRRRVYVGYTCWWNKERKLWMPRNTSVYSDHGSLIAPPQ